MFRTLTICIVLLMISSITWGADEPTANVAADAKTSAEPFQDEPAAHALYDQMINALHKADSLSVVSHLKWAGKNFSQSSTYTMWLKKPNYFRVEMEREGAKKGGILIGDGNTLWIYWPEGRPHFSSEDEESYKKTRSNSYMKKPAPPACHSIWHEMPLLGGFMPVLEPSTFHGYTDCMQAYIDGIKGLGTEKIGDEECDGIEVSIMKHQRSWYLWLSRADHLPRRLKQIVRVSYDIVVEEEWASIKLNEDISTTMFAWKPPDGWTEWKMPGPEERLLKPGQKAPDFALSSTEGQPIKLSDYRGQIVWFYIWRAG